MVAAARRAERLDSLLRLVHLCISRDAAEPLLDVGATARIAAAPDAKALFALLDPL